VVVHADMVDSDMAAHADVADDVDIELTWRI